MSAIFCPIHCKSNCQAGFTLLEALIALLIFTIGILATVSMQISSLQGNSIARHNSEAAAIAASLVEEFRILPYADPGNDEDPLAPGTHTRPDIGIYTVSYTVQADSLLSNTKSISVTVGWTDSATPRNVTLDYLIHDTI